MPQIQLTERAFEAARACATSGGFSSVDAYIEEIVLSDAATAGDDRGVVGTDGGFDAGRFFTPERLAQLDAAEADIRAGRVLTAEQVDAELARRREAWLKANNR